MIKFIFKWLFRLILAVVGLVVVAVVFLLLTYNSILKNLIEHNIREQTGMDAEIGKLDVSLFEPTIEIRDLQIYNPANFGGAPFLNIPEIHIEYDRPALMRRQLHFTLVRLNLAELDIVKNQNNELNIFPEGAPMQNAPAPLIASSQRPLSAPAPLQPGVSPSVPPTRITPTPRQPGASPRVINFEEQTGYDFTGIDKLNLSVGKVKYLDLKDPGNDREQAIRLDNWIVPHVKSVNDLAGTMVFIELRSNHFFDDIVAKNYGGGNANTLHGILQSMGLSY